LVPPFRRIAARSGLPRSAPQRTGPGPAWSAAAVRMDLPPETDQGAAGIVPTSALPFLSLLSGGHAGDQDALAIDVFRPGAGSPSSPRRTPERHRCSVGRDAVQ